MRLILTLLCLFCATNATASSRWYDRILINENSTPIFIDNLQEGYVRLQIPHIAGTAYYHVPSKVMLFHTPIFPDHLYQMTPEVNASRAFEASMKKVGEGPVLAGFPTTAWEISSQRQRCGMVYTSPALAEKTDLTLTDFTLINMYFGTLRGADFYKEPCTYYRVPAALGVLTGFPLMTINKSGQSEVQKIESLKANEQPIFPSAIKNLPRREVDNNIKAHFMRLSLDEEYRNLFDTTTAQMDEATRLKVLQKLNSLADEKAKK